MFTVHSDIDKRQTLASFDYQWHYLNYGKALATDKQFMDNLTNHICELTSLSKLWFLDKHILDMGCGSGRYTYGFLRLGSNVTAVDFSEWGIKRTEELCKDYSNSLKLIQRDILTWNDTGNYNLVFCFGVLHHTGNFFKALDNTMNKVAHGGYLFLMTYAHYFYKRKNEELKDLTFYRKVAILKETCNNFNLHGYFDAISPSINDTVDKELIIEHLILNDFVIVDSIKSKWVNKIIAKRK